MIQTLAREEEKSLDPIQIRKEERRLRSQNWAFFPVIFVVMSEELYRDREQAIVRVVNCWCFCHWWADWDWDLGQFAIFLVVKPSQEIWQTLGDWGLACRWSIPFPITTTTRKCAGLGVAGFLWLLHGAPPSRLPPHFYFLLL